jgi:hypothetical protein
MFSIALYFPRRPTILQVPLRPQVRSVCEPAETRTTVHSSSDGSPHAQVSPTPHRLAAATAAGRRSAAVAAWRSRPYSVLHRTRRPVAARSLPPVTAGAASGAAWALATSSGSAAALDGLVVEPWSARLLGWSDPWVFSFSDVFSLLFKKTSSVPKFDK